MKASEYFKYSFIYLFSFCFLSHSTVWYGREMIGFFFFLHMPDGCVYMCATVYEFRIMMDGTMKSKEHEAVYTRTLYISIHLLLMQQTQLWGSGTLCWCPNESWVIYHVESHSSSPACMLYTTPSWFFIHVLLLSSVILSFQSFSSLPALFSLVYWSTFHLPSSLFSYHITVFLYF